LRFQIEVAFIDAIMDHEWADQIMPEAEIKKFYAIRKKEGRKINPETAEFLRTCIGATDPYGLFPERPYDTLWPGKFLSESGSDVWVFEGDLPGATLKAIRKKWDSEDPAENRDVALDPDIPF
jgi:hypothetical protein